MKSSQTQDGLVRALRELVALDEHEVASYQVLLDRAGPDVDRSGLLAMRDEHRRHAGRLKLLILTLGGLIDSPEERCHIVTRGRLAFAGLRGERALLEVMKREEARVTRAYLRAMAERPPARVHDAMQVALREQLGHDARLDEVIEELVTGSHRSPEPRREGEGSACSSERVACDTAYADTKPLKNASCKPCRSKKARADAFTRAPRRLGSGVGCSSRGPRHVS